MIGGIDVHLPTRAGSSSVEVAVRAIRQCWARAVFENGLTGEQYARFEQIPFGQIEELFVYRDSDPAARWDSEGAVPGLENTMIHIVSDEDMLTLVVDEKDSEMNALIAAVKSALSDEILLVRAEREAA